jgi:hypothetical protein
MFGGAVVMNTIGFCPWYGSGIRRPRDADAELLKVAELAEVGEHADVAVVDAPAGAHHTGAVAADIPRQAGTRPDVVRVATLADVDVGNRRREHRRIEILVGVAVEPLVAQTEIRRQVRSQLPVVLDEADVVLRGMFGGHGREARREGGRALQAGDRRRIRGVERLILRERVGAGDVADRIVLVLHQADVGAEFQLVLRRGDAVRVLELIPALRSDLIVATAVGQ